MRNRKADRDETGRTGHSGPRPEIFHRPPQSGHKIVETLRLAQKASDINPVGMVTVQMMTYPDGEIAKIEEQKY